MYHCSFKIRRSALRCDKNSVRSYGVAFTYDNWQMFFLAIAHAYAFGVDAYRNPDREGFVSYCFVLSIALRSDSELMCRKLFTNTTDIA